MTRAMNQTMAPAMIRSASRPGIGLAISSRGRLVALGALAVSGALHAAFLGGFAPVAAVAPPAGGDAAQAVPLLGNDFADLAEGGVAPVDPEPPRPVTPDTAPRPDPPPAVRLLDPAPVAQRVEPARTAPAHPDPVGVAEAAPARAPRPDAGAILPVAPPDAFPGVAPADVPAQALVAPELAPVLAAPLAALAPVADRPEAVNPVTAAPVAPAVAAVPPVARAPEVPSVAPAPEVPPVAVAPASAESLAAQALPTETRAVETTPPSEAVPPEIVPPVQAETLAALPGESAIGDAAPDRSPRPARRPPEPPAERPAERRAEPAPQPVARGNADRSALRGAASGQTSGQRSTTAPGARGAPDAAPAATAAAPAAYGAAVIRKIRGTRVRSAPGRGIAVVGFEIGAGGALTGARILRSSGSAGLDAAAMDHIRRAAPFPPPPGGRASFSFEFVGRG